MTEMTGIAGLEALVILVLLCALIYGQPASAQADRSQIAAQATEVAHWKATVMALPQPTATRCRGAAPYFTPNC